MKTVWTVVEVGIILAARGMYDAEVGSSGGRCGPVVLLEGIKEGAGSVRCRPSFDWFAMRRRNKYKVKSTLKPKFARVRSTINIERKPRERIVVVNKTKESTKREKERRKNSGQARMCQRAFPFCCSLLICQMDVVEFKWHSSYIGLP